MMFGTVAMQYGHRLMGALATAEAKCSDTLAIAVTRVTSNRDACVLGRPSANAGKQLWCLALSVLLPMDHMSCTMEVHVYHVILVIQHYIRIL